MCIPCVMCGACMESGAADAVENGRCPSCGEAVPPDAVSCPHCYTFLPHKPKQQDENDANEVKPSVDSASSGVSA